MYFPFTHTFVLHSVVLAQSGREPAATGPRVQIIVAVWARAATRV